MVLNSLIRDRLARASGGIISVMLGHSTNGNKPNRVLTMIDLPKRRFSIELQATTKPSAFVSKKVGKPVAADTQTLSRLKLEGPRAGLSRTKGWFKKIVTGLVQQWNRGGGVAEHYQDYDRNKDRYTETVTMRETGEIVHYCDEPLSKHRGHGFDQPKTR